MDVALFDLAGQRVRSLVSGERLAPGGHGICWGARDGSGAPVSDGVSLVQVRSGRDAGVRKLIVLRWHGQESMTREVGRGSPGDLPSLVSSPACS